MRAIVFALRGCPAGWLGAYGNEWVATPNLDRLAAESIVFDRHISDCPDPDAAEQAWLNRGLLESLHGSSVRTVLVRANHPDTDSPPSYYAGWGEVFDARPQQEDASPLENLIRSLPSLLDKLATVPRWLVWIETDRLLPPWDVPQDVFESYLGEEDEERVEGEFTLDDDDDDDDDEDDSELEEPEEELEEPIEPFADPPTGPFDKSDLAAWEWLHGSFAAVITALDAELGSAFDELRSRGLDQTAAWFVTSDYGYPLGEHGQIGRHRPWLHEELVHLPFVMRLPGAAEAGRRVPAFTQPSDLAPTLLGLFGILTQPGSLLPLAHGEVDAIRPHVITSFECNGAKEIAIRTEEWTFILPIQANPDDAPREPMLFDRPEDRWEVSDVLSQHSEVVEQLRLHLPLP